MKLFLFLIGISIARISLADVKQLASTCAACHGEKGISANALWPNLAGQKKEYLLKQLKDFRADHRKDPVMSAQAKLLKEEDLESIAKYFSELKSK